MAEAILVDQAKTDDRICLLRGRPGGTEEALRAILDGTNTGEDVETGGDGEVGAGGEVETTNIVSFADFVSGLSRAGTADA